MRDGLAFIVMVVLLIFIFVAISPDKPKADDRVSQTICANITCYYEIKDKK